MAWKKAQSLIWGFIVAVVLNYAWELAQASFYVGLERYDAAVFGHCFVASLGDGIMVLIIFSAGGISLRRWDWYQHPGFFGYLVMLTAGLVLAVLVEWVAVHMLTRWQYTDQMPTLPGLRIGLVPIAQMLLLPPLAFRAAALLGSGKTRGLRCQRML